MRAELLEAGGPELWQNFMDELRERPLHVARPDTSRPTRPNDSSTHTSKPSANKLTNSPRLMTHLLADRETRVRSQHLAVRSSIVLWDCGTEQTPLHITAIPVRRPVDGATGRLANLIRLPRLQTKPQTRLHAMLRNSCTLAINAT